MGFSESAQVAERIFLTNLESLLLKYQVTPKMETTILLGLWNDISNFSEKLSDREKEEFVDLFIEFAGSEVLKNTLYINKSIELTNKQKEKMNKKIIENQIKIAENKDEYNKKFEDWEIFKRELVNTSFRTYKLMEKIFTIEGKSLKDAKKYLLSQDNSYEQFQYMKALMVFYSTYLMDSTNKSGHDAIYEFKDFLSGCKIKEENWKEFADMNLNQRMKWVEENASKATEKMRTERLDKAGKSLKRNFGDSSLPEYLRRSIKEWLRNPIDEKTMELSGLLDVNLRFRQTKDSYDNGDINIMQATYKYEEIICDCFVSRCSLSEIVLKDLIKGTDNFIAKVKMAQTFPELFTKEEIIELEHQSFDDNVIKQNYGEKDFTDVQDKLHFMFLSIPWANKGEHLKRLMINNVTDKQKVVKLKKCFKQDIPEDFYETYGQSWCSKYHIYKPYEIKRYAQYFGDYLIKTYRPIAKASPKF